MKSDDDHSYVQASSNAKIGQTEVTVGIPPGWGETQRLLRIVGPSKTKELIYTGKMITADAAEGIGLVNRVISLSTEEYGRRLLGEQTTISTVTTRPSSTGYQEEQQQQDEKQRANQLAKILNKKLINECISMAKEIAKNSTAVKTSKMLINKGMDVDINTGLQLEVYGWALCFAHEDRQKMMSSFLNKAKKK
ncbi:MAG: enoyl-CoA hydratase-related protein [Nitrososphaeraceae archaeon]